MSNTKVAIIGYGRMGKTIESLASSYPIVIQYILPKNLEDWDISLLQSCDVAIDFSTPDVTFDILKNCILYGVPVVSGTTGWLNRYQDIVDLVEQENGSFLYGSNFSLGMNIFFRLNAKLAKLMHPNFEYETKITEIHHTHKLDKPSGTAITLAEDLIEILPFEKWALDRKVDNSTLPIYSIRENEVPGTHIISYENSIDKINISHEAKNRDGFAAGAILAAIWLVGKKGSFTIQDYMDDLLQKL